MKNVKFLLLTIVCLAFFACVAAQDKKPPERDKAVNKSENKKIKTETTPCEPLSLSQPNEVKTLAEGSYGKAEQPFLFVARDAETYAQLKNLINNLPPASEIDFRQQAVIAAFAGTKNTGGYAVEIKKSGEKVSISVNSPPPGAIVTEALTAPYKIAVVSLEAGNSLNLDVSENWKKAAQTYRLSSGDFEYSGGFAGRRKTFTADGTVEIYQMGELVTLDFDLAGKGADKAMRLTDTASGVLKSGRLELARLEAGSFSEGPKPPLKVSGAVAGDKLSLNFEPLPSMVADGFQARGKLEAMKSK